jgi:hypothetical protein
MDHESNKSTLEVIIGTIKNIEQITPTVKSFVVHVGPSFHFLPGQVSNTIQRNNLITILTYNYSG